MATKLTHPLEREIAGEMTARAALQGRVVAPYLFTLAPEGLSVRVKGRREVHGPIGWDRAFAWLVSRALRDELLTDPNVRAIVERNPTFSRARVADAPITAEMAVEVGHE